MNVHERTELEKLNELTGQTLDVAKNTLAWRRAEVCCGICVLIGLAILVFTFTSYIGGIYDAAIPIMQNANNMMSLVNTMLTNLVSLMQLDQLKQKMSAT